MRCRVVSVPIRGAADFDFHCSVDGEAISGTATPAFRHFPFEGSAPNERAGCPDCLGPAMVARLRGVNCCRTRGMPHALFIDRVISLGAAAAAPSWRSLFPLVMRLCAGFSAFAVLGGPNLLCGRDGGARIAATHAHRFTQPRLHSPPEHRI